jgi:hypothetical protein
MPIPANIQAVINAANTLQSAESRLEQLKVEKNGYQAQIAEINDKLAIVGDEVIQARQELKLAAQNI